MREIKFRAWDKKKSVMLHKFPDSLFMKHDGSVHNCISTENDLHVINFTKNYELLQYTGLKDKNGREIYEGDICKEEQGAIYEVEYDQKRGGYFPFAHGDGCGYCDYEVVYDSKEIVVIGNRYENPELVEGNQ